MNNINFGDFTLRSDDILIFRHKPVRLPPKEISVLRFLVENAGLTVTKEDIIIHVWKGGLVSDESLTRCIYIIRKMLEANNPDRYIDTLYGKGYRFVYPVQDNSEMVVPSSTTRLGGKLCAMILPFEVQPNDNKILAPHTEKILYNEVSTLMNVIPSCLTKHISSHENLFSLLDVIKADIYIYGKETAHNGSIIINTEVVSAANHHVICRKEFALAESEIDAAGPMFNHFLKEIPTQIAAL